MNHQRWFRGKGTWRLSMAGATVTLLGLTAAAGLQSAVAAAPAKDPAPGYVQLVWPEAPEKTRIRFVDILASEADLGRKRTFAESFRTLLTGQKPEIFGLYQPRDVAVSGDGSRVYVSDFGQATVFAFDLKRRKVDIIGKDEPFAMPFGMAVDSQNNLYVVEQEARRVRIVNPAGQKIGQITSPKLVRPTDVAIDETRGLVYVADASTSKSEDHTVKVFDRQGALLRTLGNGKGDCDGCLFFPTYVAVDPDGQVYVTSTLNARVDVFDPTGAYARTVGTRGTGIGMFDKPKGVAIDGFGNVYVADSGWSNVQIFNKKGDVLLFFGGRGDYPGLLRNPTGVTIDRQNRIYVADYLNYRVTVYELVNTTAADSESAPAPTALAATDIGRSSADLR